MKAVLFINLLFIPICYAILPLPYPIEPLNDNERAVFFQEQDPRSIQGLSALYSGSQLREMELPNFNNPFGTLGYSSNSTFKVPKALEQRVRFWKKIYAKYSSSQAVLHDANNLEIIYGVVDLSHIESKDRLSKYQKKREIRRFLKEQKKKVVRKLLTIDGYRDRPLDIPITLFPIFKQFESIKDPDKFLKAVPQIRAQIGQRDLIVKGFLYGGRYFKTMMEIFEDYKIPKELTRLALVESGFNLKARSKVGASGIWQFMRPTGKRFLRIDRSIDERNDPIAATKAAARLLRKNFKKLRSWPLAITAYNHGRTGVSRAMRKLATRNLAIIIRRYRSKTFGFASSNFYASFLAILGIERDYRKYFGKLLVDSPVATKRIIISKPVKFSEVALACALKEEELANFNPALTDWVVFGRGRIPRGYKLMVPMNKYRRCLSGFQNISG